MITLYAVRLADGSFMGPRKLIPDIQSPVFFYSAADAGNAVLWMKEAGKLDPEADYKVFPLASFNVPNPTLAVAVAQLMPAKVTGEGKK